MHLGESREAFERHVAEHGWPDFVVRANLEALVAAAGLTAATVTSSVTPVTRRGGHVVRRASGRPSRRAPCSASSTPPRSRPRRARASPSRWPAASTPRAEVDTNEWVVLGEPELRLRNDAVPTRFITCTSMVNRIPDVIAAPPGLVTLDRLPRPRYRHGAAHDRDLNGPVRPAPHAVRDQQAVRMSRAVVTIVRLRLRAIRDVVARDTAATGLVGHDWRSPAT